MAQMQEAFQEQEDENAEYYGDDDCADDGFHDQDFGEEFGAASDPPGLRMDAVRLATGGASGSGGCIPAVSPQSAGVSPQVSAPPIAASGAGESGGCIPAVFSQSAGVFLQA